MTDQKIIEHIGVVTAVGKERISVMVEKEDCHSCRLKEFCGVTDSERNTYRIAADQYGNGYKRGDRVKLQIKLNAGYEALFWAYLMPFLLVTFTIILTLSMGISEKWAGIISLLTLPPYYFGLNRSNKSLSRNFKLDITKYE